MTSFKTLGSLSIAATLAATAALALPATGTQNWTATITNAPASCSIGAPTVDAVLVYNSSANMLEVASYGRVEFDLSKITTISAQTDGFLKINGVPHTSALGSTFIGYGDWINMDTTGGQVATTIEGVNDKVARSITWTLQGDETGAVIEPGSTVSLPADLTIKDNDVVTLTWNISCGV